MDIPVEEIANWYRVGGHRLNFFATDEEVQRWLLTGLPDEFAPYRIIADRQFTCEVQEFFLQLRKNNPATLMFYVWSRMLMPDLALTPTSPAQMYWNLNGLVGLMPLRPAVIRLHPHDPASSSVRWSSTALTVVDRVKCPNTGEMREYPESRRIFQGLRRMIMKELVYVALGMTNAGVVYELPERMTEGAANNYEAGVRYECNAKPGHRIK
jgi:hypothetical protein